MSRRKTKRTGQNQNWKRDGDDEDECHAPFSPRCLCPLALLYARHVESRERVLVYLNLRLQKDVMAPRPRYANGNALVSRGTSPPRISR